MERILKIIIGVILAILVFMWISSVYKSCGSSEGNLLDDTTIIEDPIDYSDDGFKDDFFEEDEETAIVDDSDNETNADPVDDYEEVIEEPIKNEKPAIKERPVVREIVDQVTPNKVTSFDSKYMVLAGSYLIKGNAESMVDRLKDQGYSNAEVVVFDNSQYHSVLADRTDDYNEALQLSSQLKRKGIDNYVHTKQD